MKSSSSQLARVLNVWDAGAVMIGIIVGSGIFITPAIIARNIPSLGGIVILWTVGGTLSLFGALAYAELAAALPKTGGHYAFAREAYGPFAGFILGWAYLLIGYPCSLAGIAAIFGLYTSHFIPLSEMGIRLAAAGSIVLVAVLNYIGVKESSTAQRIFAYGKVVILLGIVLSGFILTKGHFSNFTPLFPQISTTASISAGALVAAMVGVMWTYDGWCDVTPIAGEVGNPSDMSRSISIGMISVILVYAIVNVAYVYLVPLQEMAGSNLVAADAAKVIFGPIGAGLISALILFSTFGALNGNMIAAPRVFFAMAHDGIFFRKVGEIHPRFKTPHYGILTTLIVSVIYVLSGTFEEIINYFIFISWIFYMLNVAGVIVLRRRQPQLKRPYRTWGYPVTPILFILAGIFMLVNIFVDNPYRSSFGLVLILIGIPTYYVWKKRSKMK